VLRHRDDFAFSFTTIGWPTRLQDFTQHTFLLEMCTVPQVIDIHKSWTDGCLWLTMNANPCTFRGQTCRYRPCMSQHHRQWQQVPEEFATQLMFPSESEATKPANLQVESVT